MNPSGKALYLGFLPKMQPLIPEMPMIVSDIVKATIPVGKRLGDGTGDMRSLFQTVLDRKVDFYPFASTGRSSGDSFAYSRISSMSSLARAPLSSVTGSDTGER